MRSSVMTHAGVCTSMVTNREKSADAEVTEALLSLYLLPTLGLHGITQKN